MSVYLKDGLESWQRRVDEYWHSASASPREFDSQMETDVAKAIEKGITDADLGVGISTDDQGLRISFPELTSERRTQLSKIAGDKTEHAKVTLRSHRTDALKALETAEKAGGIGEDEVKRLKAEIQKLVDAGNESLAKTLEKKETEIAQ